MSLDPEKDEMVGKSYNNFFFREKINCAINWFLDILSVLLTASVQYF